MLQWLLSLCKLILCNSNLGNILSTPHAAQHSTRWTSWETSQRQNIPQIAVAQYQFSPGDMSLQHIPWICTCNIFVCKHVLWFCPCNFYPLCVPATCRLNVHNTSFCNMSLQHNPLCLPAFELFHKHWLKNIIGLKGKQFIINNRVATDT